MPEALPAVTEPPSLVKAGRSLAERLDGRAVARELVGVDHDVALAGLRP